MLQLELTILLYFNFKKQNKQTLMCFVCNYSCVSSKYWSKKYISHLNVGEQKFPFKLPSILIWCPEMKITTMVK